MRPSLDRTHTERRSTDIPLHEINSNNLHPLSSNLTNNTDRTATPYLAAQSIFTRPRSSGSFRGTAPPSSLLTPDVIVSYPEYSQNQSEQQNNTIESQRHTPVLRGVDDAIPSTIAGERASSLFDYNSAEETNAFQQGLEDALGKDGNWLTKQTSEGTALPEINQHQLGLDFEGPDYTLIEPAASRHTTDEIRAAEEGLPHFPQRDSLLQPRSAISRAVKSLSTRILTGQPGSSQIRDNSKSPIKRPNSNSQFYNASPSFKPFSDSSWGPPSPLHSTQSLEQPDYFGRTQTVQSGTTENSDPFYGEPSSISFNSSIKDANATVQDVPSSDPLPIKLIGTSLKIFGPENKFRLLLYHTLDQVWVEPLIFFLIIFQTVILTIANAKNIFGNLHDYGGDRDDFAFPAWGRSYIDWCQLAIFICYTFIVFASIIAYGLWDDSQRKDLLRLAKKMAEDPENTALLRPEPDSNGLRRRMIGKNTPVVRSFVNLIPGQSMPLHHAQAITSVSGFQVAPHRAYLRSSWARIDFIAVVSYWISMLMIIRGLDAETESFIFRMLSALPILHILNLTRGTSSILKSLKVAAPLLVNVGVFVGFFW